MSKPAWIVERSSSVRGVLVFTPQPFYISYARALAKGFGNAHLALKQLFAIGNRGSPFPELCAAAAKFAGNNCPMEELESVGARSVVGLRGPTLTR